jgi:hypothetical protein
MHGQQNVKNVKERVMFKETLRFFFFFAGYNNGLFRKMNAGSEDTDISK